LAATTRIVAIFDMTLRKYCRALTSVPIALNGVRRTVDALV
jgi:hypothetical protein